MPKAYDKITGLIQGISRQSNTIRLKGQLQESTNLYPSISENLKRRPGTEHKYKLNSDTPTNYKIYTIDRNAEQYKVLLYDNDLKVYDMNDGTEKSVTFTNGKDYITDSNPQSNLELFNIGDYTFVLNKGKTVAMAAATTTNTYENGALVFVRQGDYSTKYTININGSVVATKTTSDSAASDIDTDKIATDLETQLNSALGSGWTVDRSGSVLYIIKADKSSFTFKVEDSNGNNNLYGFYGTANTISDLPLTAPNGFKLKVAGDAEASEDDYYVEFVTSDGDTFSQGVWIETVKPGIKYKFDASTMPHVLIRESNGTFTFKQATWGEREVGDEDTNEEPSFVGKSIKDITLFKDRLGFVLPNKIVYSRINYIFNFWKESVLTELDTDPIDLSASDTNFQNIHHGIPFGDMVLLLSKDSIYKCVSTDTFAYDTAYITLAMRYESADVKPVAGGNRVFFPFETGNYSGFREVYQVNSQNVDAIKITQHIPNYIPKNIMKLTACTSENVLACLSSESQHSVYVYKYYYTDTEKAQSAWQKWTYNGEILDIEFIQNILSIVVQYDDGIYLEEKDLSPANYDNQGFYVCLDRKQFNPTASYDSSTNETTFTLDYPVPNDIVVVNGKGFSISVGSISGNQVVVSGDYSTDTDIIVGIPFTSELEFSKFYKRDGEDNAVTLGRLQLKFIEIDFDATGYFQVQVIPDVGTTSTYTYTGKIIGSDSCVIGTIPITSDTYRVPVNCKNEDVTIKITNNTHLPSAFVGVSWVGIYSSLGK